ncbi:uncharacterized protein K02A2.6-like [Eupeodes corollae]|uniref:uncharacterized protein K02A2.6-like n=1 Tax=Eupeodes corollae TaxID=290404 RepID=UPI002493520D|nr:uncharacterized protein K02A2.6-like [Eupeodes corollae]
MYKYWNNIDKDIERLVRNCENCATNRSNPPKASVHPWDTPQENWERVHIDYAGPFQNFYFLFCIDAKSKWAEIIVIKDIPTSSSTIQILQHICSTHGYPQVMVSDNANVQTTVFSKSLLLLNILQQMDLPNEIYKRLNTD